MLDKIVESPIGSRLARGSFWSLAGGCFSRLLALVASIIIARILGKETFGQLGILQSTLDMFGSLAGFGMGLTSTKYVSECRQFDRDKTGRIIAMSSLVAWLTGGLGTVILICAAPWLASHALAAPQMSPLLQISAISLLFGAVNGAQGGGLAGFEAFKQMAKISLITGVLTVFLRVGGTVFMGLRGAVYGMVVAQIAGCVINFMVLRRLAAKSGISVRYSHCLRDLPIIWKFSLPAVLTSILIMPTTWFCNAMLVNRPRGYGDIALYNAANQWFYLVLFIPGLMGSAAMPVLFDRMSHQDYGSVHKIFFTLVKINAVVMLPLVPFIIFSRQIMGLYGNGFGSGWETLVIVLVTAGLQVVQMPTGYILSALGRMWLLFFMELGRAVCFVGLSAVLVYWGSIGLAAARLLALGLHCLWTFTFVIYVFDKMKKTTGKIAQREETGEIQTLATLEEKRAIGGS